MAPAASPPSSSSTTSDNKCCQHCPPTSRVAEGNIYPGVTANNSSNTTLGNKIYHIQNASYGPNYYGPVIVLSPSYTSGTPAHSASYINTAMNPHPPIAGSSNGTSSAPPLSRPQPINADALAAPQPDLASHHLGTAEALQSAGVVSPHQHKEDKDTVAPEEGQLVQEPISVATFAASSSGEVEKTQEQQHKRI